MSIYGNPDLAGAAGVNTTLDMAAPEARESLKMVYWPSSVR